MNPHLIQAIELIKQVCSIASEDDYLKDIRKTCARNGTAQAVASHNTSTLLDWLLETVSYQGVSDVLATRYMDEHGRLPIATVEAALDHGPSCPRLVSFQAFAGCGYRKLARICAEPGHFSQCPLPSHDLRNGRLNQVAYGLALFARDVCRGDFVAWIDDQLAAIDSDEASDPSLLMQAALLEPLSRIHGVSFKVLSMALADLLLGAGEGRDRWIATGSAMVAIDTLVHNWLTRTGILRSFQAEHLYGPACYQPGGCAAILHEAAQHIDARTFCPEGPRVFPRLIQHAIWRFCAGNGLGICNGNRIDDRFPCHQSWCALFDGCDRQALIPVIYKADFSIPL